MLKKGLLFSLATFLVASVTYVVVYEFTLTRLVKAANGTTPFTATVVENRFLADGTHSYTETGLHAGRSHGSTSVITRRFSEKTNSWFEIRQIRDLPGKRDVYYLSLTNSVSTYPLSETVIASRKSYAFSTCSSEPNPERGKFLGYDVVKVRNEEPDSHIIELWLAPALGCFAMQETLFMTENGGPYVARVKRQATVVVEGEPDRSLFEIPTGVTESKPSEVNEKIRQMTNAKTNCPTCEKQSNEQRDKVYTLSPRKTKLSRFV